MKLAPICLRHENRATLLAVACIGSMRLDATPGMAPENDNAAATPKEVPELKWINVANEGDYRGHGQGEFSLNPQVLQELVDNFHASPKFSLGDVTLDGQSRQLGVGNVVQFDYEHASEMAPWEGTIPITGAPAIGWVRDLELRKGADSRLQLWALSWLGAQIRGQIQRLEYDSVSIAWNPQGVHWITGEPIGAVLTSVAFTNHPFLQDLQSLAARELSAVSRRAAAGAGGRAAGQPPNPNVQPRARTVEAPAGTSTPARERASASMTPENRARLCSMFGLMAQADDTVIIRAAENASTKGGNLSALMQALGLDGTIDDAIKGASVFKQLGQALADAQSELAALQTQDAAADETQATPDVAAGMGARGLVNAQGMVDPLMHAAFTSHRASCIATEMAKLDPKAKVADKRAARERGRQAFLASCGVNNDPATQHLTRTFAAGPGAAGHATQYPVSNFAPLPAQPQLAPGAPMQLRMPGQPLPTSAINWDNFAGNMTQRIMGYLATQDATFDKLDHGAKIRRASEWRRINAHLLPQAAA